MVNIKLILKNYGVYEWIIVRFSGILVLIYMTYILSFILISHKLSYEQWCDLFNNNVIKIFNVCTLFFILVHTWIGIRHILEDYIKPTMFKKLLIRCVLTLLYIYLLLGIIITWGM